MISIIILSYRPEFLKALLQNIPQTIGTSFETIVIDNKDGNYSLCGAYNEGARKAKGEYFCFVHEDVIFKSEDWGKEFISAMQTNPRLGLLGIVGSKFKSAYPTAWYNPVNNCTCLTGNIWQGKNSTVNPKFTDFSPSATAIDNVVCLDGVLLFTSKAIMDVFNFDENLFKGFHGYDIDFSLQVCFAGYEVAVLKSVKLLHYSSGNPNKEWAKVNSLISNKWLRKLPVDNVKSNLFNLIFMEFKTIYIHDKGHFKFLTSLRTLTQFFLRKLKLLYNSKAS